VRSCIVMRCECRLRGAEFFGERHCSCARPEAEGWRNVSRARAMPRAPGHNGCTLGRTDTANPVNIKDNIAILVVSCDRYSDLWEPFFSLFWRFWPDCPFRVYLLANTVPFSHAKVTSLLVGTDHSWSDNLLCGLGRLTEEYVVILIDDLLLIERVDTAAITEVLEDFARRGGDYLRMNPSPQPDRPLNHLMGYVSKGTIYRTATVSSVWSRQMLLGLLVSGETAWDFEIYGSLRSDAYDGFYSTHKALLPAVNAVIKGKWERGALAAVRSLGVNIYTANRPVMASLEWFWFRFCLLRTRLLLLLPPQIRRRIRALTVGRRCWPVQSQKHTSTLTDSVGRTGD
jgi:hypothetical protein